MTRGLSRLAPAAALGLGVLCALALLAGSQPGPDLGHYQAWASAIESGTMSVIPTDTVSPVGVPSVQWSAGPGSLIAGFSALMGPVAHVQTATYLAGWLAALGFWLLAGLVLWHLSGGEAAVTGLGLGTLFLATHAGFYTRAHASESLTYPAIALVAWVALRRSPPTWREALWTAGATALVIMGRPYLAVYTLPAWVAIGRPAPGDSQRPGGAFGRVVLALAAVSPALGQTLLVNDWMTGSPWRSPYDFGDAAFRSLDWQRPELAAALLHPWHGLLPVHPFYAVGFGLLIVAILQPGHQAEKRYFALSAAAVVANLYVQASWYVWWLGTGTFGMRGLAAAAVPCVAALVYVVANARRPVVRAAAGTAAIACSLWSLPFLRAGNINATTASALWTSRDEGIRILLADPRFLVAAGVVAVVVSAVLPRYARQPRSLVTSLGALVTISLALALLLVEAWERDLQLTGAVLLVAAVLALASTAAMEVADLIRSVVQPGRWRVVADPQTRVADGIAWILTAAVLWALCTFAPLVVRTQRAIAGPVDPQQAGRRFVAPFTVGEVVASYREYQAVEGFDEKKEALRGFLERSGALAPSPPR